MTSNRPGPNSSAFASRHGEWWVRHGKRIFDVTLVLASAIVWLPMVALLAAIVLITSGRPVIFSQKRVGLNNRTFTVYKLRTMSISAPVPENAMFASWTYREDARVTKAGRLLRRWRLDELPQLVNVLRGDMSLVGPRPETPEVVKGLSSLFPNYNIRHLVLPGLTGLCQVSPEYQHFHNISEIHAKLLHDLHYVDCISCKLDLSIVVQTVAILLGAKGVA